MATKKTKKATGAGAAAGMTIGQRYDYAKLLYTVQGVTVQKELAERVGVSAQTINKWVNADDKLWDRLRASVIITKEEELRRMYMQLTELNDVIFQREKGQRFANSKEADILVKLTASVRQLETDTSVSDVMEVMKKFIMWVRQDDHEFAVKVTSKADHFIKSLIK